MAVDFQIPPSHLPLYLLSPPYTRFGDVASISALCTEEIGMGTLLALGISDPEQDWPVLHACVPQLRSRFPALPVVLRLKHPSPDPEFLNFVRRTGGLRVRAVLPQNGLSPELLRRMMTEPIDIADDVVEWLSIRKVSSSHYVADLIHEIFRRTVRGSDAGDLQLSIGESARTARRRFQARGLPSPGQWREVARAIHAALWLQREQGMSQLAVAVEHGYSDHSALSHQMVHLFGLRPTKIRELVAWEWLLDRWLNRTMARR